MSSPRNKKDDLEIEAEKMDKSEDLILTARKFENIPEMFKTDLIVDILCKKEKLEELDHKLGVKLDEEVTNTKQEKKKESKLKRLSGKFFSNKDMTKDKETIENNEIGSKHKVNK